MEAGTGEIGTATELFGLEIDAVPGHLPMYPGMPKEGFYVAYLVEKSIGTGEYGPDDARKTTPETNAKVWFVGGRPGEPVNSVYDMLRMRFSKHDAMRNIEPGDVFVAHVYSSKGNDGKRYQEMSVMRFADVRAGAEIMLEASTLGE